MAFDMLIGSDELRARLAGDVLEGTLSHAYILEGARGSGKRTLSQAIAAALACERRDARALPCTECPACRKVLEGKSPDVIRVARQKDKASIGVDDVRYLRSDVLIPPNDLENKIYIIEQADLMTEQAQNALLLTLEEPPSYVLFLLLCERATALLETIRSRAPVLRLCPVSERRMEAHLRAVDRSFAALDEEQQKQILLLSDGSVGRALELLNEKERRPLMARRALAASYVQAAVGRADAGELLMLLPQFASKREELIEQLQDVQLALRDLVLLKRADDAPLRFYTDRSAAQELCARVSMSTLFGLLGAVEDTRGQLLRNANVRLAMTSLLLLR